MKIKLVGEGWSNCGICDPYYGGHTTGDIIVVDAIDDISFHYEGRDWYYHPHLFQIELTKDQVSFNNLLTNYRLEKFRGNSLNHQGCIPMGLT